MAYDEELAERVREALSDRGRVEEKKMFGGLAFMVGGHMACGVVGDDLMARIGPDAYDDAVAEPHVRPMDFTGKPLKGMIYVGPAATKNKRTLRKWVSRAADFTTSLPAKKKTAKKKPAKKRARRA